MVNLIFHMSYFNFFVKISQIIYQLILSYQKLNYLRWYDQGDFLADYLVHYYNQDYLKIKNVIKPLAKSVLILLGFTTAKSHT